VPDAGRDSCQIAVARRIFSTSRFSSSIEENSTLSKPGVAPSACKISHGSQSCDQHWTCRRPWVSVHKETFGSVPPWTGHRIRQLNRLDNIGLTDQRGPPAECPTAGLPLIKSSRCAIALDLLAVPHAPTRVNDKLLSDSAKTSKLHGARRIRAFLVSFSGLYLRCRSSWDRVGLDKPDDLRFRNQHAPA
jgi:hypothetical protein